MASLLLSLSPLQTMHAGTHQPQPINRGDCARSLCGGFTPQSRMPICGRLRDCLSLSLRRPAPVAILSITKDSREPHSSLYVCVSCLSVLFRAGNAVSKFGKQNGPWVGARGLLMHQY